MSEHVTRERVDRPGPFWGIRDATHEVTGYWWLWLVAGISWVIVAITILQFDTNSVRTVGIIVGLMFLFAGLQEIAVAAVPVPMRWLWATMGVLLVIGGIVCLANPVGTFVSLADSLAFLFLLVGLWWISRSFLEREFNSLWWLGLVSGALMTVLAFWSAGQFFIEKAYVLLVFAGVWALMEGMTDITRAFAIREVNKTI